jgi:hypothetical protein
MNYQIEATAAGTPESESLAELLQMVELHSDVESGGRSSRDSSSVCSWMVRGRKSTGTPKTAHFRHGQGTLSDLGFYKDLISSE